MRIVLRWNYFGRQWGVYGNVFDATDRATVGGWYVQAFAGRLWLELYEVHR